MTATRIIRPETAFAETTKRGKRPRQHDGGHLAFIRTLPSVLSGLYGCDAAHIRYGSVAYKKPKAGAGEKPDDRWTLPLTRAEHTDQHAHNEIAWWETKGIDPLAVCMFLHSHTGDEETCTAFILDGVRRQMEKRR